MDAVANTFKIQVYILIGKAQHLQMIARQKAAALGIAGQTLFGKVLGTVQLDNATKSSKCNRRIKENFSWGFPAQAFSWAGID